MIRRIIKIIAAVLIFSILFLTAQSILSGKEDIRDSKRITGFYEQRRDSLDAVFVGSSATYAFWSAPYAWMEYGIAVYPYSAPSLPVETIKFIVEEARKTQPDALYIINITSMYDDRDISQVHHIMNEMPLSLTKLKAIHYICKSQGYTLGESMEFYFPILRFHDRWYEVRMQDIRPTGNAYKSGNTYNGWFTADESLGPCVPNEGVCADLPDNLSGTLHDLVDYLETEGVTFMFVIVPQTFQNQKKHEYQNAAVKLMADRGYEVLNLHEYVDEMGIEFDKDFYNNAHTNFRGAIKVTAFLSEYLTEYCGLMDKRGDPAYADWDEACENYYRNILEPKLEEGDMVFFKSRMAG